MGWISVLFSRKGVSSPLGKLDDELPKIRISSFTMAVLKRMAAEADMNPSEFVRTRLDVLAFGVDEVKRMRSTQLDRVVRMGGAGHDDESFLKKFLPSSWGSSE